MRGKIEKIWENQKNGNRYWVLAIDGEKYSVWNEKHVKGLTEGCSVEYSWKKSGNFRKITGISRLEGQPVDRKTEQIIRMSCLRSASEILSNLELEPQNKTALALDISRVFERYVVEGSNY